MSLKTKSFEFGEFSLDEERKVLMRHDQPVSITPKAFQLLLVLVKDHGRPLAKSELIREVWADSFVEEGNLTFTINLVRKALGDDRHSPRFIETIPKHGYRFITEVKEVNKSEPVNTADSAASLKSRHFFIACAAVLLVSSIVFGFWYQQKRRSEINIPILTQPFALDKISFTGKTAHAVISPDGKNVFYTNEVNGKQSVWLRQLELASNVEIIPPSDNLYMGMEVSPDGKFLYVSRTAPDSDRAADIYRVSILGGVSQKIVGEAQGWMSLSPDGTKISFVRCPRSSEEYCSLWIADAADGRNERKIVSRPRPLRLGDNRISLDGKTIVFVVGQSENVANEVGLNEVEIETGRERQLTPEKFFNIRHLVQLPGNCGWLITAKKSNQRNFAINLITPTGEVSPLTKDSETYSQLSLDSEAARLASTQIKAESRVTIFQADAPSKSHLLEGLGGSVFAPDGKLFFTSEISGNNDIWAVNADGTGQQQLTNDASDEAAPAVSPDNSRVYFMSNRTGEAHVWQMSPDGSNQIQLTRSEGGFPICVSPDGAWVYYIHGANRTLWRVAPGSGEEQKVFNKAKYEVACSPDGTRVAFFEEANLVIASLSDGQILKMLPLAHPKAIYEQIAWSANGKKLIYSLADKKTGIHTLWQQSLEGQKPQLFAELGSDEVQNISVAPDGRNIAVTQRQWIHDAVLLKGLR